jgi:chromosome segregation ATPase
MLNYKGRALNGCSSVVDSLNAKLQEQEKDNRHAKLLITEQRKTIEGCTANIQSLHQVINSHPTMQTVNDQKETIGILQAQVEGFVASFQKEKDSHAEACRDYIEATQEQGKTITQLQNELKTQGREQEERFQKEREDFANELQELIADSTKEGTTIKQLTDRLKAMRIFQET